MVMVIMTQKGIMMYTDKTRKAVVMIRNEMVWSKEDLHCTLLAMPDRCVAKRDPRHLDNI